HGRVVAAGTPAQIKRIVGGQTIEVTPARPGDLPAVTALLGRLTTATPHEVRRGTVAVEVPDDASLAPVTVALAEEGIAVGELALRLPTLDEAFLALVGDAR
ncbi:MAG: ATP-binding protein DrrA1-3 family domain-containing protein, partial [Cellulomonadaceae bacterium]